ncbi:MAG: methylenetetrahydrofolate reductase [NAD(P)H] [Actinomycetes bacterium]
MATHLEVAAALRAGEHSYSFEFFPPKTDAGEAKLWHALRELESLQPTFASVTYGAGGTTQDRTVRLTRRMAAETTLNPVAHLTCVGADVEQLRAVVAQYADAGVRNILALRGDPSEGVGTPWVRMPDGLNSAIELVSFVRALGDFAIGVGAFPEGHPESPDLDHDARVLVMKANAGASFAITQFFFDLNDYVDLVDRVRAMGCEIPIIPGIMPVSSIAQITRFGQLSGGAFPADLAAQFDRYRDDPVGVAALGVDVAAALSQQLLDAGAPGLHFYTLNASSATREIFDRLNLRLQRSG